jgi:uncharacterized protein (TIGR02147 family)
MSTQEKTTSSILRDVLARKISRNPGYSLRAFARDLGVSHTYLSLVMNGHKPLSMRKVLLFSKLLELSPDESSSFIRAGTRDLRNRAIRNPAPRARSAEEQASPILYYELESDRHSVLEEWYHLPIMDLTQTDGFRNDPKWIARRLGISPEQVKSAVNRLLRLQLLKEENGTLVKTTNSLTIHPKESTRVLRAYHQSMIQKAWHALDSDRAEDIEARNITAVTMPVDPARIEEAKKRISKFRRQLWKFLEGGNTTELYQFNLQLFPLSKPESPRPPSKPRGKKS